MPAPEIQVPTVQAEATPLVPAQGPPLSAYVGVGVGAAISKAGEELHQVGMAEHHRAMEAKAQEAETAFQKRALALRDEYRNKFNWEAVDTHAKYAEALEKARAEIGNNLPSKYALSTYNNNSLRNSRFVQESMDAHYEQQNRSYQFLQHKDRQDVRATSVAKYAVEKPYNAAAVENEVVGAYKDNLAFATSRGMDEKAAQEFATTETHKVTDAQFSALFDKKSGQDPELIRSEMAKYSERGLVSANKLRDSQHAIGAHDAKAWVGEKMANFVRIDHLGHTDPEGYIPYKSLNDAIKTIPETDSDEVRQEKIDLLKKEWERDNKAFDEAGHQMSGDVLARRVVGDKGSLLWQKFDRLYSGMAQDMEAKVNNRAWTNSRHAKISQKEAAADAWGATRYMLDSMNPDQIKDLKPETVDAVLRQNYSGNPYEIEKGVEAAKAREFLKKLQEGKLDPTERRFGTIANQVLEQEYKGNKVKTQANMNRAHYILDDLYKDSKAAGKPLTEDDLRVKLTEKFKKEHWYSDREGESYTPRRGGAVVLHSAEDFKALKSGDHYIDTDGKEYVK